MARIRKNAPAMVEEMGKQQIDFSALAENVREDKMLGSRATFNPFTNILRESYLQDDAGENGVRAVDVFGYQVRKLVGQLRNAAIQLANEDIGLRIRYAFVGDNETEQEIGKLSDVPEDGRTVTVKFLGRPKKVYLTDDQRAEAVARGYVLDSDPTKIDRSRYFEYLREAEDQSENGDDEPDGDDEE